MDFKIQQTIEPSVIYPTIEQFANFSKFIENLEEKQIYFAKVSSIEYQL